MSVEREVFPRLVGDGLYALTGEGSWRDIGTPASYLAANLEQMPEGGLIDPTASVDPEAVVTDSVVGGRARIEPAARVSRSVVLPGATVAAGSRVHEQVIGLDGRPVW